MHAKAKQRPIKIIIISIRKLFVATLGNTWDGNGIGPGTRNRYPKWGRYSTLKSTSFEYRVWGE